MKIALSHSTVLRYRGSSVEALVRSFEPIVESDGRNMDHLRALGGQQFQGADPRSPPGPDGHVLDLSVRPDQKRHENVCRRYEGLPDLAAVVQPRVPQRLHFAQIGGSATIATKWDQ